MQSLNWTQKKRKEIIEINMKLEDGYISYIINPKAGASSHKYLSSEFKAYLEKRGFDVRVNLTKSLAHACELATDAAVDFDCAMVVTVGGDGTIREVLHGLEGSDKPLMMVPCGTENLLASELGFDMKLSTLIKTFESGHTRSLDLGVANGKCFTSICGFGFDADVVELVSAVRDGHINHLDYFWPIWRTFWNYKFDTIKVIADGEEVFNDRGFVFVGNISRYAIGLNILRNAKIDDGLLDLCIYKCASKARLIKHSAFTVFKQHHYGKDVIYKHVKKISVSSPSSAIKCEVDGDPGPNLPVEIEVLPGAVTVAAPENGKPAGISTRFLRSLG